MISPPGRPLPHSPGADLRNGPTTSPHALHGLSQLCAANGRAAPDYPGTSTGPGTLLSGRLARPSAALMIDAPLTTPRAPGGIEAFRQGSHGTQVAGENRATIVGHSLPFSDDNKVCQSAPRTPPGRLTPSITPHWEVRPRGNQNHSSARITQGGAGLRPWPS